MAAHVEAADKNQKPNQTVKTNIISFRSLSRIVLALLLIAGLTGLIENSFASGPGGGGGGVQVDSIKVSKCYCNSAGQMLIKAASSDPTARLLAYRPDGSYIGEVQNGGGSRYGGTVMPWQPYDPLFVTIISSSGGSITVATTPFQI
jgi:hypothetical protein